MPNVIDISPHQKRCPHCAERIRAEARMCRFCGSMLSRGPRPIRVLEGGGVESASDLSTMLSDLCRPDPFRNLSIGDRRMATLLRLDFDGLASSCGRCDALRAELMAGVFATVEKHSGIISESSDSTVLAVFGVPVANESDPLFALDAASDLRGYVKVFNRSRSEEIHLRAGVHTGLIVKGLDGVSNAPQMKGPAVSTVSRLTEVAERGEVIVSADTHRLAAEHFSFEIRGPLAAQDLETRASTHRLIARVSSNPASSSPRVFDSPFSGRADVVADLCAFITGSGCDHGCGVIEIQAARGMGKSRTVAEAIARCGEGFEYHRACAVPWAQHTPFHTALNLLRSILRLSSTADSATVRERISSVISSLPESARPDDCSLRHLLGDRDAIDVLRAECHEGRSGRVRGAIVDLLREMCTRRRLVIFLDDFHWADSSTVELIGDILDAPGLTDCRLILASIPRAEDWAKGRDIRRIGLEPLSTTECDHLLEGALGESGIGPTLREQIAKWSEGNPLQINALVESVQFDQAARPASHRGGLESTLRNEGQDALRSLLHSRIDRLSSELQTVLRVGAVLGTHFQFEALALIDLVREGLIEKLLTLESLSLLERDVEDDFLSYRFRNLLTRDTIFGAISPEETKRIHELAAAAMERLVGRENQHCAAQIAHHWETAGNLTRAAELLTTAGQRAFDLGDLHLAEMHLETAIHHLGEKPSTVENQRTLFDAMLLLGEVERLGGKGDDSLGHLRLALNLARMIDDERLIAHALLELSHTHHQSGGHSRAVTFIGHAMALPWAQSNPSFAGRCHRQLGITAWQRGQLDTAIEHCQEALALCPPAEHPAIASDIENNLGLILWTKGELPAAQEHLKTAADLRRLCHMIFGEVITTCNLGIVAEQMGNFAEAHRCCRSALRRAEGLRFQQAETALHSNIASLMMLRRYWHVALEHSGKALEIAHHIGDRRSEAIALENTGLCQWELGWHGSASDSLDQATTIAQEIDDRERQASVTLGLVPSALVRGEVQEANDALERARTFIDGEDLGHLLPALLTQTARVALARQDTDEAAKRFNEALIAARDAHQCADELRILRHITESLQQELSDDVMKAHEDRLRDLERQLGLMDVSEPIKEGTS